MLDLSTFRRSDAEIAARKPIKVILGDTEYDVKPHLNWQAEEWRERLMKEVVDVADRIKSDLDDDNDAFMHGLMFTFLKFPKKILDLCKAYAPKLPWDETILARTNEDGATEEQIARMFGQVVVLAFPFTPELSQMNRVLALAKTMTTTPRA